MAVQARKASIPNILSVVLLVVLLAMISFIVLIVWHTKLPLGAYALQEQRSAVIGQAYVDGRFDDVVTAYESPLDIFAAPYVNWKERRGFFHRSLPAMRFQVAQAYAQSGNEAAAERIYLRELGLDIDRYREFCRHGGVCPGLQSLRHWAELQRDYSLPER